MRFATNKGTENFCKRFAEHYRAASKDEEVTWCHIIDLILFLGRTITLSTCPPPLLGIHAPPSSILLKRSSNPPETKVTEAFIDTAITLSKRVLCTPSLVDLLLRADETRTDNPFDSWTKLQVIVSKCRSPNAIEWVLHCMPHDLKLVNISPSYLIMLGWTPLWNFCSQAGQEEWQFPTHPRFDGWKNSYITTDQLTWRGLRESLNGKGTVDLMIQLMDFREYLFSKVVSSFPGFLTTDNMIEFGSSKILGNWNSMSLT